MHGNDYEAARDKNTAGKILIKYFNPKFFQHELWAWLPERPVTQPMGLRASACTVTSLSARCFPILVCLTSAVCTEGEILFGWFHEEISAGKPFGKICPWVIRYKKNRLCEWLFGRWLEFCFMTFHYETYWNYCFYLKRYFLFPVVVWLDVGKTNTSILF